MIAVLEVPAIRQRAMRFSVKDYHRFTEGQPTELLRGTIIQKMSKSPLHYDTIEALREILTGQIPPGFVLRQEGSLTLHDSEPEPDIAVVRGARQDFRTAHPPTAAFVIEVAVSSIEIDRVKASIYAEAGVAEYWIVCPDKKQVEIYRGPGADGYAECTMLGTPAVIECAALPGVRVALDALFA